MLTKLLVAVAVGYAGLLVGLYFMQRSLMYFPDATRVAPAQLGLTGIAELQLTTPDGERLIAWYGRAAPGQPTILYFHGNAGNLSNRADRVAQFAAKGWGIFMLSYRGYGGSSGRPSEAANHADASLAHDWLSVQQVPAGSIVAYGESLGTAVAARLAVSRPVGGLILDAPFTSMADMAARLYPWLWVRPFVRDRYESAKVIGQVKAPVLILHGEKDDIVPVAMGRALAAQLGGQARLVTFANGDHVNLFAHGALEEIARFMTEVSTP